MNENSSPRPFPTKTPIVAKMGLKEFRLSPDGIKLLMPIEPNVNHVGVMYAGSLFTLAEMTGGAVFLVYLDKGGTFPIIKSMNIKYTRPARTDITSEYIMDLSEAERIINECNKNGKADYNVKMELKDKDGTVVVVAEGLYQIRKDTKF